MSGIRDACLNHTGGIVLREEEIGSDTSSGLVVSGCNGLIA